MSIRLGAAAPAAGPALSVAMVIQRFRPDFGGQGIQLESLCHALARRGIQPVVLSAIRGRASDWEEGAGYRIRRLRADVLPGSRTRGCLWMPTFALRVLVELLRLPRVDVVHVHGLTDGLYGAYVYCRLRGVPLVFEMTLMGTDDPGSVFGSKHRLSRARGFAYRNCDGYVAMSRAFLPSYAAASMPEDRLHVIPQGVDTGRFRPLEAGHRAWMREKVLGFGPDDPVVVFVGSLIERKGIDVLLAAWSMVHAERPDARLVLVGRCDYQSGSDERRFLDAQIAALPAAAKSAMRTAGLRDDTERFLGAGDVFAFPSRREGFGSAIIEAMACGLPAVVADLEGITDFIFGQPIPEKALASGAAGDGIVVPQNDARALSRALLRLLNDRSAAAEIGAAGLRRARDRFDFDRAVAPAYEQLYASVARGRPR